MSADQEEMLGLLRDSFQRYVAESYTFERRAEQQKSGTGFSHAAWRDYADFGWLALRLPETLGGVAADASAIGALMESVGAGLLMEPILSSAILGTGLLLKAASEEQQAALLPKLADGSLTLAFAHEQASGVGCRWRDGRLDGGKINVLHGDLANRFIVSCRDGAAAVRLCLVDASVPGVQRQTYSLIDGRSAARLSFDSVVAELLPVSDAADLIAETLDEAAVALCAEATALIARLVAITTQYLKDRKQFGRPIGSNQALQHRMADLFLLQEEARALTLQAQLALAQATPDRARLISGARAYIITAARRVANEAVQMHGGVGVTEELPVSHYFRRLMVNAALFGVRETHFQRFLNEDVVLDSRT